MTVSPAQENHSTNRANATPSSEQCSPSMKELMELSSEPRVLLFLSLSRRPNNSTQHNTAARAHTKQHGVETRKLACPGLKKNTKLWWLRERRSGAAESGGSHLAQKTGATIRGPPVYPDTLLSSEFRLNTQHATPDTALARTSNSERAATTSNVHHIQRQRTTRASRTQPQAPKTPRAKMKLPLCLLCVPVYGSVVRRFPFRYALIAKCNQVLVSQTHQQQSTSSCIGGGLSVCLFVCLPASRGDRICRP